MHGGFHGAQVSRSFGRIDSSVRGRIAVAMLLTLGLSGCENSGNLLLLYLPSYLITSVQSLFDGVVKNDRILEDRLERGLSPDSIGPMETPISIRAIQLDALASFSRLVNAGADVEEPKGAYVSVWNYSINAKSQEYLGYLSSLHPPKKFAPSDFNLALTAVAKAKRLASVLPKLMNASLDWDAVDDGGLRPTDVLLTHGEMDASVELLSGKVDPRLVRYETLVEFLAPELRPSLITLLKLGVDSDAKSKQGRDLLFDAVEKNDTELVSLLFSYGATGSGEEGPFDAQVFALMRGKSGVARQLLALGADPDKRRGSLTAVDAAEMMLDADYLHDLASFAPRLSEVPAPIVRALHLPEAGGSTLPWTPAVTQSLKGLQRSLGLPNHGHPSAFLTSTLLTQQLFTDLLAAAASGDETRTADLAAKDRALVVMQDAQGWTALMHAVYQGNANSAQALLRAGAAANVPDKRGSNALLLALMSEHATENERANIVDLLLANGGMHTTNSDGVSSKTLAKELSDKYPTSSPYRVALQTREFQPGYIAVMGKPGARNQDFRCSPQFPGAWIKTSWDAGLQIEQIGRFGNEWCVVVGKTENSQRGERYFTVRTDADYEFALNTMDAEKYALVDADSVNGTKVLFATTAMRGNTDGFLFTAWEQLQETIKPKIWDKKANVDEIAWWGNRWLISYGGMKGYYGQAYNVAANFHNAVDGIRERWKEGRYITSIAKGNGQWLMIFSKGSGLKDQTLVIATDRAEFEHRIRQKYTQGWRINALLAEDLT